MLLNEAAEVLKALADPTRLRLVALLCEHGVLCVCELEEVLEVPQYTVSRHLGILRRAGLVENRRDGVRMDYLLRADVDPTVKDLVTAAVGLVREDSRAASDRAKAGTVRPGAPNCPA